MSEPVLCPLPEGGPLATSSSSPSASPPAVTGPCDAGPPALAAATSGSCAPSFANGLNVAWVNYASDIPNPDLAVFKTVFQNTYGAGGRVARWWFHTNGSVTPGYDANGLALPISCADIADVRSILDTAYEAGVMVNISIWSFDMLEKLTPELQTNNKNLLTVDTNRQAYIDNVLTPLVTALKGHPGLYSWEIFNEPEGMATGSSYTGQGGTSVDESYIQRSVNWFAAAIHDADPSARVTNGTQTFYANADIAGMQNYYSDAALIAAGGESNGTLDFYEVHYYESNGPKVSCFLYPASHWNLDKPVVMGEFYAIATDGVAGDSTYTTIFSNGYAGAWAWQYESNDQPNSNNDDGSVSTKWPTMQVPMQNLYSAHAADVTCTPATGLPPAVQLGDD